MNNNKDNKKPENKSAIFTKETLGVIIVLFATLCLVCLITRDKVFSVPGQAVNAFLLGMFGYFAYAIVFLFYIIGIKLITDKSLPLSGKTIGLITSILVLSALLAHVISMSGKAGTFGEYLSLSYSLGAGGIATASGGGIIMGLISYPIATLLTDTGASVLAGLTIAGLLVCLIYDLVRGNKERVKSAPKFRSSAVQEGVTFDGVEISGEKEYPIDNLTFESAKPNQKLFVNNEQDFSFKTKKEIAKGETEIKIDFSGSGLGVSRAQGVYTEAYADEMKKKIEYIKTPAKFDYDATIKNSYYGTSVSEAIPPVRNLYEETSSEDNAVLGRNNEIPMFEHESRVTEAEIHAEDFSEKYAGALENDIKNVERTAEIFRPFTGAVEEERPTESELSEAHNIFGMTEERADPIIPEIPEIKETVEEIKDEPSPTNLPLSGRRRSLFFDEPVDNNEKSEQTSSEMSTERGAFTSRASIDGNDTFGTRRMRSFGTAEENKPAEEQKAEKPPVPINRVYRKPPLDLLERHEKSLDAPTEDHEGRMAIIKQTLEEFHINAEPKDYIQGPTITRYEIMMPPGISVKRVLNYDNDLKMRLSSRDGVRIEAPIPGKNAVGIEVANKAKEPVGLRELLEQTAGEKLSAGKLIFAIGKDIVGRAITDNLAKGPHYLVAGATGSGKSVCLNVMIVSLLMRYSPEELRLILVDPKSVGFRIYEHIPHLMIDEIITEPKRALAALSWAQVEMERRYKVFAECPTLITDIEAYNTQIAGPTVAKMPRIVVVIDELADLMETCKKDMEAKIRAIAQKARAAGIHLVLATQRPSVDIITGTIKANLPSRIALKVMNFNDSQTILSEAGAEKLLGNGDMLYKNSSMAECERYQGAYLSDREITNVVNYIKENNEGYFDDDLKNFLDKATNQGKEESEFVADGEEGESEVSELFLKALWLAITSGTVSISQLQRRFQIGYARAGGLVDKMEQMGFVSGNEGSKARRVLITREEYEERFGSIGDAY